MSKHTFVISISDGFCEHSYPVDLPNSFSVSSLADRICGALSVPTPHDKSFKRGDGHSEKIIKQITFDKK